MPKPQCLRGMNSPARPTDVLPALDVADLHLEPAESGLDAPPLAENTAILEVDIGKWCSAVDLLFKFGVIHGQRCLQGQDPEIRDPKPPAHRSLTHG